MQDMKYHAEFGAMLRSTEEVHVLASKLLIMHLYYGDICKNLSIRIVIWHYSEKSISLFEITGLSLEVRRFSSSALTILRQFFEYLLITIYVYVL